MALARWQGFIQDRDGRVQEGASVEVRLESTGALAALYADRDGTTPKANPFLSAADGYVFFHAVSGAYKITATLGDFTMELRYVPVGTGAETDAAAGLTREVTAAGDVTVGASDLCVLINKTVGAATSVNIPSAADRNGLDVMIKDMKLDAAANNITPVFDGSEECDGLSGAEIAIKSNGGFLWMRPKPDGSGYTMLASQL